MQHTNMEYVTGIGLMHVLCCVTLSHKHGDKTEVARIITLIRITRLEEEMQQLIRIVNTIVIARLV